MTQALQREILREKSAPRVVVKHLYGNLYNCDPKLLSDPHYLENVVREASKIGNMRLLDIKYWKIGEGVSILGIILESHISIHTWPEYSFATVDVYSCGAHTDPDKAFDYIVKALKAESYEKRYADRTLI
jgi:S-adenosylmethionine decarboxylase